MSCGPLDSFIFILWAQLTERNASCALLFSYFLSIWGYYFLLDPASSFRFSSHFLFLLLPVFSILPLLFFPFLQILPVRSVLAWHGVFLKCFDFF
jgi:predicted membrane channel-forming protein YqfA (hemolysin III family)